MIKENVRETQEKVRKALMRKTKLNCFENNKNKGG
jgi:hypothetical protein